MTDYWLSTKSDPQMWKASYRTAQLDAFFIETYGVDPSILATQTGLSYIHVMAYQRQLGLRPFTGNGVPKRDG